MKYTDAELLCFGRLVLGTVCFFLCVSTVSLRLNNRGNIFVRNVAQQCCIASSDCLLYVLPPPRATHFHVATSKSDVYFLQHENLLREKVVIRATNNLNLQRNVLARQVARKCCPYYWPLSHLQPTKNVKSTLAQRTPRFMDTPLLPTGTEVPATENTFHGKNELSLLRTPNLKS